MPEIQDLEGEEWKSLDFLGFPRNYVSNKGRMKYFTYYSLLPDTFYEIKRLRDKFNYSQNRISDLVGVSPVSVWRVINDRGNPWKLMKLKTGKGRGPNDKYEYINLEKDGYCKKFAVHRLVLIAFIGQPPHDMEACHYDDNPKNNSLDNLRWGTKQDNWKDRKRIGKSTNEGYKNGAIKFSIETALIIKDRFNRGTMIKDLAKEFNVRRHTISNLVHGKSWKNLNVIH